MDLGRGKVKDVPALAGATGRHFLRRENIDEDEADIQITDSPVEPRGYVTWVELATSHMRIGQSIDQSLHPSLLFVPTVTISKIFNTRLLNQGSKKHKIPK